MDARGDAIVRPAARDQVLRGRSRAGAGAEAVEATDSPDPGADQDLDDQALGPTVEDADEAAGDGGADLRAVFFLAQSSGRVAPRAPATMRFRWHGRSARDSSQLRTYKPTANPTPEPSRMPTPMPTYPKCEDDLSWAKKGEPRKTCNWVAALESRCVVKGDDDRWAFEACRESCDTCLRENLCSITGDSPTWIHASGQPFKNCQWVADFSGNRCAQPGQDGSYAFRSCPVACRTCGYGCGRDDPGWYKAGDAPDGRDCDWVGSATGVRCDTMGADGKLAFAACPAACRACAGAFGNCEDDKTWHKRGDVSKNCRWIDDTPSDSVKSQRCVVKGEDSDYAFLSCPVACGTC